MAVRVQRAASHRLDDIYRYTLDKWGPEQAERYIAGLFDAFARIESRQILSRPIPAHLGVDGYFCRFESHFIYWKWLADGDVGIVTILHERMHQIDCLRDDYGL